MFQKTDTYLMICVPG